MGYLSYFQYEILPNGVKINNSKCNELEQFFADKSNSDIFGFRNVKIETDGDQLIGIYPEENPAKFYDDELFILKLSECIESGKILIQFIGEEGDIGAYIIKPNEVECMYNVLIPASEYENLKKKYGASILRVDW